MGSFYKTLRVVYGPIPKLKLRYTLLMTHLTDKDAIIQCWSELFKSFFSNKDFMQEPLLVLRESKAEPWPHTILLRDCEGHYQAETGEVIWQWRNPRKSPPARQLGARQSREPVHFLLCEGERSHRISEKWSSSPCTKWEQHIGLYTNFVDLSESYDTVNCKSLWKTLAHLVPHIPQPHKGQLVQVKETCSLSDSLLISSFIKQECVRAPTLLSIIFSMILCEG